MTEDHNAPLDADGAIAVIGYTGRFAGARNPEELWWAVRDGAELAHVSTDEELLAAGVPHEALDDPSLVRRRPVLEDAEMFDAAFFGYTPAEAAACDPQQRLFLEAAWQVMETAGHVPRGGDAPVGVFAGGDPNTYLLSNVLPALHGEGVMARFSASIGNERDFIAPRAAYKLDLRGPAITVLAGCATSLVAVHTAAQSLLSGETDMAIAGGATVYLPQYAGYFHQEGGVNSRDGRCRPFSAAADGTVHGDAVVAVLLRRLSDALADGDQVHGVIRGSAVNNDGAGKVGFTAPSVAGQAAVISEALAVAGVDPGTVDYVETHGTGTRLGDVIEVEALARAFEGVPAGRCRLGALKPVIGHTDTAAGVAGLIKVLLAFEHEELPPIPDFTEPNPRLDLASSPFRVNDRPTPWPRGERPRRAGVSSFSVGGTNAHVVLEEPPPPPVRTRTPSDAELFVVSARTPDALSQATAELAESLREGKVDPADAAHTLRRGRAQFEHRHAVVAEDAADAAERLAEASRHPGTRAASGREVAFLFPGQGSQFAGMGGAWYREDPTFAAAADECAEILTPLLGCDPRAFLTGPPDSDVRHLLDQTRFTQPLLFTVEYAMARTLAFWGVEATAMAGHSVGEHVAACLAGVLPLSHALTAVAERGRLMGNAPRGMMAAVGLAEEDALEYTGDGVELAAVNGPRQCVLSGEVDRLRAVIEWLRAHDIQVSELVTSHAFHSALVDSAVEPFVAHMRTLAPSEPRTAFTSGVTGTWITAREATSAHYWGRQLRETVRFSDAHAAVARDHPEAVFLEVGPGATLRSMIVATSGDGAITTLGRSEERDKPHPRQRLAGRLWAAGISLDWDAVTPDEGRRRVRLPTYPFQRARHWIDPPNGPTPMAAPAYTTPPTEADTSRAPDRSSSGAPADNTPVAEHATEWGQSGDLGDDAGVNGRHPRPYLDTPYAPPGDGPEETIAAVWAEAVGVAPIGVDDDFFALGGDSLLAARIAMRIQERFPVDFGAGDVLASPSTVAACAQIVRERLFARLGELTDDEVRGLLSAGEQ